MATPKILITVLTVAALGSTPAVASAAAGSTDRGGDRIAVNHNEVLVTSEEI
jgi:hypothetical protein